MPIISKISEMVRFLLLLGFKNNLKNGRIGISKYVIDLYLSSLEISPIAIIQLIIKDIMQIIIDEIKK
jgi:hypothetical protein